MHKSNKPIGQPLSSFPIVSTGEVEEARAVLSRELVDVGFLKVPDRRSFGFQMNGVQLGRTSVGYNQFDADTRIDPGEMGDVVVLVLGTGPSSVFELDGEPVLCPGAGAIVSRGRRVMIHRPAGGGAVFIRAPFDAISKRIGELTDRPPRRPITYDRSIDLTSGIGARTGRLIGSLLRDLQCDPSILESPLLRNGIDELVLNAILSLPNTYSAELTGSPRKTVAPGIVKQAEAYLEAHAAEPVTVRDIVAQCEASQRALFAAFRRFRGYTPMQFLTACRLKTARESLLDPDPLTTVTSVAHACGFTNAGRFAGAYRRRFGESPSATLRRAR